MLCLAGAACVAHACRLLSRSLWLRSLAAGLLCDRAGIACHRCARETTPQRCRAATRQVMLTLDGVRAPDGGETPAAVRAARKAAVIRAQGLIDRVEGCKAAAAA